MRKCKEGPRNVSLPSKYILSSHYGMWYFASMGPRNVYKDMLENTVSPIACVSMNHQNQLEQMANGVMFATRDPLAVEHIES
jgi:hypothetical protein